MGPSERVVEVWPVRVRCAGVKDAEGVRKGGPEAEEGRREEEGELYTRPFVHFERIATNDR